MTDNKYPCSENYGKCNYCDYDGVCSITISLCIGADKCKNTHYPPEEDEETELLYNIMTDEERLIDMLY